MSVVVEERPYTRGLGRCCPESSDLHCQTFRNDCSRRSKSRNGRQEVVVVVGSWGMWECFKMDAEAPGCSRYDASDCTLSECMKQTKSKRPEDGQHCRREGEQVASVYCGRTMECEGSEVEERE